MKGYGLALQFSPIAILSDEAFDTLHSLLGDQPALGKDGAEALDAYKAKLEEARALLATAYAFSAENAAGW